MKHRVLLGTLSPFNARLNHRRKAAGFILRMFQLHDRRSSAVGFIFRLVRLNLSKPAGIAPCFRFKSARLPNPSEALPYKKPKIPHSTPPMQTT